MSFGLPVGQVSDVLGAFRESLGLMCSGWGKIVGVMKAQLLSAEEIESRLVSLPGWRAEGPVLVREFQFPSYLAGIEFVRVLAVEAEELNHHPDLFVGWRKVTVKLSTHSAGGVTTLDFELAERAERCATSNGGGDAV